MSSPSSRFAALCVGTLLVAGCAAPGGPSSPQRTLDAMHSAYLPQTFDRFAPAFQTPALLTINRSTSALESWPISPKGGKDPQKIATIPGLSNDDGVAANGTSLAIANGSPPSVVLYDVATKTERSLPDPYGLPLGIAIDKQANLYVANDAKPANVAMYPAGSSQPIQLVCNITSTLVDGVTVDDEGDILLLGWGSRGVAPGVFEIPNGPGGPQPQNCVRLPLKSDGATASGMTIDPKTDDLIVMDNPSQCAGGAEGRITIYPKPYDKTTSHSRVLGGNCPGGLILDASSSIVFYTDSDVSGSYTFIRQASYPGGQRLGIYWGGTPGPITTMPNQLPN